MERTTMTKVKTMQAMQAALVAQPAKVETVQVTMNIDNVEAFAGESVTAFVAFDRSVSKASVTKMEAIQEAAGYLPAGLTASDYDRLVGKAVRASLAQAVKRGKLEDGTSSKIASQLKKVALALANGLKPEAGQGFIPFYNAAVIALEAPSYAHVYGVAEGAKRTGKPAGTASHARKTNAQTQAPKSAPVTEVVAQADPNPLRAAALILTKGHAARADKLVTVMGSFVEEFDKWTATILEVKTPTKAA
jgi:hypothetical protein